MVGRMPDWRTGGLVDRAFAGWDHRRSPTADDIDEIAKLVIHFVRMSYSLGYRITKHFAKSFTQSIDVLFGGGLADAKGRAQFSMAHGCFTTGQVLDQLLKSA